MLVMEEKPVKPLLSPSEVAQILNVSERTVGELLRSRRLVGMKVGRDWRIDYADVADFIERSKLGKNRPEYK